MVETNKQTNNYLTSNYTVTAYREVNLITVLTNCMQMVPAKCRLNTIDKLTYWSIDKLIYWSVMYEILTTAVTITDFRWETFQKVEMLSHHGNFTNLC